MSDRPGGNRGERDSSPARRPSATEWTDEVTSVSRVSLPAEHRGADRVRDRAVLTVVAGPQMGSIFVFSDSSITMGRARECSYPIDDPGISRRHAKISRDGTDYVIEDLGSRNGTFVNSVPVTRARLVEGDRVALGSTVLLRFGFTDAVEEAYLRRLYESSVRDGLTGTYNRRYFTERMSSELAFAARHHTALSLLLIDFDHFKRVNDTHGHLAGDYVLKAVASALRKSLRVEDILARFGGEEFAIVVRGANIASALAVAERLRIMVQHMSIEHQGVRIPTTISIGVASLACCMPEAPVVERPKGMPPPACTLDELVSVADRRLYACKAAGRNCCIGAD